MPELGSIWIGLDLDILSSFDSVKHTFYVEMEQGVNAALDLLTKWLWTSELTDSMKYIPHTYQNMNYVLDHRCRC